MISNTVLLVVAIVALVVAVIVTLSSIVRARRLRRELDDQGIKLIQISNLYHDLKKTVANAKSEIDTVKDWFDRTNRTAPPAGVSASIASEKGAVDDQTLRMQGGENSNPGFSGFDVSTRVKYRQDNDEAPTAVQYDEGGGSDTNIRLQNFDDADTNILKKKSKKTPEDDDSTPAVQLRKRYREFSDFVRRYRKNLTKVGLFYASSELLPVGTRVDIDFCLKDGSPLLSAKGEVKRLHRETGGTKRNKDGMDIRFIYLDQASKDMIRRILAGDYE